MITCIIILSVIIWLLLGQIAQLKMRANSAIVLLYITAPFVHIIYLFFFGFKDYLEETWNRDVHYDENY